MHGDGSNLRAEQVAFELLGEGLSVAIAVTGWSMSPFLHSHDVVEVEPLSEGAELGDVVVFPRSGGGMVVHRVVGVDSKGVLLIRGDGTGQADGWILPKYVAGRVVAARRADQTVRWGLGPESRWIARLSRWGLLAYLLLPVRWWIRRRAGELEDP